MLVISGWRLDLYLNILRKLFGHNYQVWTFSIFSVYRDSVHIVILVLFDLSKLQSMIQMKRCSVYAAGYLILHIQDHYWAWLRVTQWVFNKKGTAYSKRASWLTLGFIWDTFCSTSVLITPDFWCRPWCSSF